MTVLLVAGATWLAPDYTIHASDVVAGAVFFDTAIRNEQHK
jgi:hypothetical protein